MKTLDRLFWPLLVAFIVCVAVIVVALVLPTIANGGDMFGHYLDVIGGM